jgi:hypothetical protein
VQTLTKRLIPCNHFVKGSKSAQTQSNIDVLNSKEYPEYDLNERSEKTGKGKDHRIKCLARHPFYASCILVEERIKK